MSSNVYDDVVLQFGGLSSKTQKPKYIENKTLYFLQ